MNGGSDYPTPAGHRLLPIGIIAPAGRALPGNPDLLKQTAPAASGSGGFSEGFPMSKEKNKGHKEAKKPKKEKPKVLATAGMAKPEVGAAKKGK